MIKVFYSIIVFTIITSCNSFDKNDIKDVAELIEKSVITGDLSYKEKIDSDFDVFVEANNFKASDNPEIITSYFKGKKYEKIKTTENLENNILNINNYYQIENDTVLISSTIGKENNIVKPYEMSISNLSRDCYEKKSKKFVPFISFLNPTRTTIQLKNNENVDLDYIKFLLEIYSYRDNKIYYSRTIEVNNKFYSNDLITIDIPPFYLDVPNLTVRTQILDAAPKPIISECEELKELKKLK
ncbi:hypothetical protein OBK27_09670 [Empedobacter falsenii]